MLLNRTRRSISLGGARLQNRGGNSRNTFKRGTSIRGGKRMVVYSACLKGKRRPAVKGARYYACVRRVM